MKITIDDKTYHVDLQNFINGYRALYAALRTEGVTFSDGTFVQFSGNSVLRTALKMIMTPLVIPMLRKIYESRGLELPQPVKHEDLIDYTFKHVLNYLEHTQGVLHVNFTSEAREDSGYTIKQLVTTIEPENQGSIVAIGQAEDDTQD